MNDDQLDGLKQFIGSQISQSEARIKEEFTNDIKQFIGSQISQSETRIKNEFKEEIQALREDMNDGFSGVGEAIEQVHNRQDDNDSEHLIFGRRLTKLEQQPA